MKSEISVAVIGFCRQDKKKLLSAHLWPITRLGEKMFLVVLDIIHFKQIKSVTPEVADNITDKILSVMNIKMGHLIGQNSGIFTISFPDTEDVDAGHFGDFLWEIYRYLSNLEEDLFGFYLFITKVDSTEGDRITSLVNHLLLTIPSSNAIWVHDDALENFKLYFHIESATPFSKVIKPLIAKESLIGQKELFFHREGIQEKLREPFTQLKDKVQDFDYINLYGDPGTGRLINLKKTLEDVFCVEINQFSSINCPMPNSEDYFAQRQVVDPRVLKKAAEYLTGTELSEWQMNPSYNHYLKGLSIGIPNPITSVDAFRALYFYFLIYHRHMKVLNLPPLVIIQDFLLIPENTKKHILDLMNILSPKKVIFPVFLTKKSKIKGIGDHLKGNFIPFKPLTPSELRVGEDQLGLPHLAAQDAMHLLEITSGRSLPVFHFLKTPKRGAWQERVSGLDLSFQHLLQQEKILLKILYITIISTGILSEELMIGFFIQEGFKEAYLRDKLKYLRMIGFLRETKPLFPSIPRLKSFLSDFFGTETREIKERLTLFISAKKASNEIEPTTWLYYFFEQNHRFSQALEVLNQLFDRYFTSDNLSRLNQLIYKTDHFKGIELDPQEHDQLDLTLFAAKLRLALFYGTRETAITLVEEDIPLFQNLIREQPMLAGEYFLAIGQVKEATRVLKEALVKNQDIPQCPELVENYILFGLCLFKSGRFQDGLDYLDMALNILPPNPETALFAKYYNAVGAFIIGKYDVANNLLQSGEALAREQGLRYIQSQFLFLLGRLRFELGEYQGAMKDFNLLGQICRIQKWPDFQKLSMSWRGRCQTFLGNGEYAIQELQRINSEESLFFQGEAYYLVGDFNNAYDSFFRDEDKKEVPGFLPVKRIKPLRGSSFLEDHLGGIGEAGSLQYLKERSMWQSLLGAKKGEWDKSISFFQQALSNEALLDHDLKNSQYLFFFYHILNQLSDRDIIDPITILNKGYKILQERASENQESRIKLSYLRNNYWSQKILEEAKKNRLI